MNSFRAIVIVLIGLAIASLTHAEGAREANYRQKLAAQKTPPKADSSKVATIEWVPFDEGLKRAESQKKAMLLDFTASWCGWCKKMEKETFSDTSVVNLVNKNFVAVRVWGDSEKLLDIKGYKISEKDLAVSQFGIQGYPSFYFLCPDGLGYKRVVGYRAADAFKSELTQSIGFNCDSLKTVYDEMQKKEQQDQQGQQEQPKSDG